MDDELDWIALRLSKVNAILPPSLMRRVSSTMNDDGRTETGHWPSRLTTGLAVGVPIVLLALLGASALELGQSGRTRQVSPGASSASAATSSGATSDAFTADLKAANLTSVRDRVSTFDLADDAKGGRVRLVAGYADAVRTVFIVDASPVPTGRNAPTIADDQGLVNSSLLVARSASGHWVIQFNSALRPAFGSRSSVKLGFMSGPELRFQQDVQPSQVLVPLHPAISGRAHFTFDPTTATPNAILLTLHESGASIDDLEGNPPTGRSSITVTDSAGNPVPLLVAQQSIASPKSAAASATPRLEIRLAWLRIASQTYHVTFAYRTGQAFSEEISVGG